MVKTALVFLILIIGTAPALAKDGHAHVKITNQHEENVYGVLYRVHTPHTPLYDAWLRIDLNTAVFGNQNRRIADPEKAVCRLQINREDKSAADYAQYSGGALYLYFDRLDKFSVVEFSVGWRNPADAEGPVPEFAALEFKSDGWEKTASWEPAQPRLFPIVRKAQITIQDGTSCDLY